MMNHEFPPVRPSVKNEPKLELKSLEPHLRYVFMGRCETLPIIIAVNLKWRQVECLVSTLKRFG